jgi:hypothetical protein
MEMHGIPFGTTDWALIPRTECCLNSMPKAQWRVHS